jgi:hypothetical protein
MLAGCAGHARRNVDALGSGALGRRGVVGSLAAGGGAAWPASSCAMARRRGPLPAAPLPRTPPQRTPRRNAPCMTTLDELAGPVVTRQMRQSPGERLQQSDRNAAHCTGRPLHPQGHPKILSNRSAESIFRTHPCARNHYRPCGPDGEGQALKARGEDDDPRDRKRDAHETIPDAPGRPAFIKPLPDRLGRRNHLA